MKKNLKRFLVSVFALAILAIPVASIASVSFSASTQLIQPQNDFPDIETKN